MPTPDPGTASAMLLNTLRQYGLNDIAKDFMDILNDPNFTQDTAPLELQKKASYQAMFPGMADLVKKGLAINEGQYLQQEDAYRQVLKNYGMPNGFYDSKQDFANWMKNEVSAKEVQDRLVSAKAVIDSSDPSMLRAAQNLYGIDKDHLIAYTLDPQRAQPLIDKMMRGISVASSAEDAGFNYTQNMVSDIQNNPYAASMSDDQLRAQMQKAGELAQNDARLSRIDNEKYNSQDAIDATIKNSIAAQQASTARQQRELARFSGSSAGGGMFGSGNTAV